LKSGNRARRRIRTPAGLFGLALICLGAVVVLVGCGGGSTQGSASPTIEFRTPTPAVAANTVTVREWAVQVPAQVKPGTYTYTITNSGQTTHELLVFQSNLAVADYPTTDGDITEDGPGITKISDGDNLAPGESQQRTVDLTQPGTYLFVCNLPGHFSQGMHTVVTVAP
jgi:uncharacterized cupredoxin-like copper-binding protein